MKIMQNEAHDKSLCPFKFRYLKNIGINEMYIILLKILFSKSEANNTIKGKQVKILILRARTLKDAHS